MSSATNPTSSGNQGDPWEQLAEDLFGLEYGKEHGSRESSPLAVEPAAPEATPPIVDDWERPAAVSVPSPAEAEPQHRHDEPSLARESTIVEPESSPGPESSREIGETSSPAPAETGSPQDSYWDALANWNWDESDGAGSKPKSAPPRSSGGPPPRGGSRGRDARGRDEGRDRRGGEKPQRQDSGSAPPSSSPPAAEGPSPDSVPHSSTPPASPTPPSAPRAPRPAAPAAGDDFGLGVADSQAEVSAPKESRAPEDRGPSEPRRPVHDTASRAESSTPAPTADRGEHRSGSGERGAEQGHAKPEEGEFPRKRRRRRRRRSRGGDREPGSTTGSTAGSSTGAATNPASPASDDEWDDSAGPESESAADEPQTPLADSREETKDAFEGDRHVPARGPRRGHRNERTRREGPPRRSNAAPSDAARSEPTRSESTRSESTRFESTRSESTRSESTRSEGRGDEGSEEFEEEPLLVGGGAEEPAGEDDGEDDASEQAVSYEDVPSWEEAISYLLHPNQVQVEPGAGNGAAPGRQAPAADQPRQTRHLGGHKPRR